MDIGRNIKIARKQKKMTQNDLAIKANISRSYLADVEGNRYNPSIETLDSIARALDVQIGTLLSDSSKKNFSIKNAILTETTGQYDIRFFNGFQYDLISLQLNVKYLENITLFIIEAFEGNENQVLEYLGTFYDELFISKLALEIVNNFVAQIKLLSNNEKAILIWKGLIFSNEADFQKELFNFKGKYYIT
ncbi:helix-turn-helix transcriptional regulator [Enterococcus hirae]|uniref:helix-turn-helix domain-containing protein n=1 Tax=Enterococcus TaxID=1350 RepID=UPI0010AC2FE5|nr:MULTISPECIES: helix-turn-helix transcriptional regulator [Enterococcus]MDT2682597.1 helix-turn-helix transcriptional regulator [Enterococcus gallinarum]QGR83385.1 helix-turn-helix domain-containing protein [Enterococcus gallinarum]TJY34975.1 helix-turn-helix transcriptional regulator [Enterococcus hirae]